MTIFELKTADLKPRHFGVLLIVPNKNETHGHWVGYYVYSKNLLIYFDSYMLPIHPIIKEKLPKKMKVLENKDQYQFLNESEYCGHITAAFLESVLNGNVSLIIL